jgi:choice-of-anchor A domain-containing protein
VAWTPYLVTKLWLRIYITMTRTGSTIVCLLLLPALSPTATAGPLDPATSSNVFALRSASISAGNIQGALTAGGNVTLLGANVGSIYAQGNLSVTGVDARGSVLYGGTFTRFASNIIGSIGQVTSPLFDFPATAQALTDTSAICDSLSANGAVSTGPSGTLLLTGTDPVLNVFDITLAALGTALAISAPAGSTVVVNISGASPDIEFAVLNGLSGSGQRFDPSHVLFNFPEATTLFLLRDTIAGTVLAPGSDMVILSGGVSGTLIANDLSALATNFYYAPFAGGLTPAGPDPPTVPEPSSVTLLGLGGAALLVLGHLQRLAG